MQPSLINQTLAFVSEGDLYITAWTGNVLPSTNPQQQQQQLQNALPAVKLTTTVGNVRDPIINPIYPYLIAYTATYTGRRDVYVMDLRRNKRHGQYGTIRLTYWPTSEGVHGLVGWNDDGRTLIFSALSNEVSLPDIRMYELTLSMKNDDDDINNNSATTTIPPQTNNNNKVGNTNIQHPQVLQTNPVPLSQALEGIYHESDNDDDDNGCWYFTRFQQSSHTARYQGGTAESIWAWCFDQELAVPLTTHHFNGTSKAPSIFTVTDHTSTSTSSNSSKKRHHYYLLFMSDRGHNDDPNDPNEWKPTTMNLWAMPLPGRDELLNYLTQLKTASASNDSSSSSSSPPMLVIPSFQPTQSFVQLTQVSCDFDGYSLREYSLDPVQQNIVLRIGADLHWLSADIVQQKLEQSRRRHEEEEEKKRWLLNDDNVSNVTNITTTTTTAAAAAAAVTPATASGDISKLQILVYSDFHEHQERLIPLEIPGDMTSGDVYETAFGSLAFLMTARGQAWVAPVVTSPSASLFSGAGQNLPQRRYRIAPGSQMGGAVRVLTCRHVPLLMQDDSRRVALILATDPRSPKQEHAFYLIETQSDASPSFVSFDSLPEPFVGGHNGGGSVKNGGLGSVVPDSVRVSPCGRRFVWVDTDGRICVMTLPMYKSGEAQYNDYVVLPKENEQGEPLIGAEAELIWSPGGRYLAIEHNARNQFTIISIVDCGDPFLIGSESKDKDVDRKAAGINVGRIVQVTPDRFNSYSPFWGKSSFDHDYYGQSAGLAEVYNDEAEPDFATTTLYFLTDRAIANKQRSPWGTRAPNPYFENTAIVYALPLLPQEHEHDTMAGHFSGGGGMELYAETILDRKRLKKKKTEKDEDGRLLSSSPSSAPLIDDPEKRFPLDPEIVFGPAFDGLTFARTAYRMSNIPESTYTKILSQAKDDGSLLLIEKREGDFFVKVALVIDFPSDKVDMEERDLKIDDYGLSTTRDHVFLTNDGDIQVVPNSVDGYKSLLAINPTEEGKKENVVLSEGLIASVWPSLEYPQLYGDAWRMMRDYFYDPETTGIDWDKMFDRFLPLVRRCTKREELDDILAQMASEVSALHVFVYGGEYNIPLKNDPSKEAHVPATFGVAMQRSLEWRGFVVTSIPELDPDFVDKTGIYSPLSHRTLRMSGQTGLKVGDVIVAVNGESVVSVPDIHVLLRGLAHQSVRLEVLRLNGSENATQSKPEPVLAVPLNDGDNLLYSAWEWKTRKLAKTLAADSGFSVGYVHLRSMGASDSDAFYRHFFPDYDKDALIIDVRHNRGGNIDWWLLDVLQRKAWMYWQGRSQNATTGGLGWDEQFAFRGHIVVLIDEKTSSDGEGFSRGMSELGLGRLIGSRTWGGEIPVLGRVVVVAISSTLYSDCVSFFFIF